jgi:hypothetical protein
MILPKRRERISVIEEVQEEKENSHQSKRTGVAEGRKGKKSIPQARLAMSMFPSMLFVLNQEKRKKRYQEKNVVVGFISETRNR